MLDPFRDEHAGGYLADSQFDYPGRDPGWRYYALDAANQFAAFTADPQAAGSATPLAFLVCDDPYARVGRDTVHAGYLRRPCMEWHAPAEGDYRLEGEVALLNSDAHGGFEVRVIVDDVEVLQVAIDYAQMLTFVVEAHVRDGGFVRVLFGCRSIIDANDALHYLRIRAADAPLLSGERRVSSRCEEPSAWQRLRETLRSEAGSMTAGIKESGAVDAAATAGIGTTGADAAGSGIADTASTAGFAGLAHRLYVGSAADPDLLAMIQAAAHRQGAAKALEHRRPRFFTVHPVAADARTQR